MKVTHISLSKLQEAPWNSNTMTARMYAKLKSSLQRYGLLGNLVVRPLGDRRREVLSGNQRLKALRELGYESAPCVTVDLGDAQARLLSQVLNNLHGEDEWGLRAELVRQVIGDLGQEDVLAVLPETAASLQGLASLGQDDLSQHLRHWDQARAARLHHLLLQLTDEQHQTVQRAIAAALKGAKPVGHAPNRRGQALAAICAFYLEKGRIV